MENDTNAVPIEEDSLTNDLAAAWDAAETGDDEGQQESAVFEADTESDSASGDATSRPDTEDGAATPQDGIQGTTEGVQGAGELTEAGEKPPVALSPEAREAWNEAPQAIKDHIVGYEKRMEGMAQKYGANAQRAEAMDKALAPYSQLFAMNGGPGETLPGLLQTASLLQMGSAPQKAQTVANLIKQFGVDIKTLDSMLVGEAPPAEVQQQSQMEQMLNQRLQPLQQQLQSYQQREQQQVQQVQQQTAQEVSQFGAQHEFYNDVRSDMADLLDMAANRGRQMTMEEAYNTACAAHPQISKIVANRTAAEQVAQKKQAAVSVHGSSGGSMEGAAPNSIADALNSAWDNAGRM